MLLPESNIGESRQDFPDTECSPQCRDCRALRRSTCCRDLGDFFPYGNKRRKHERLKRWIAFLRNHKDDIAAMDLFAVPTASLRLLYGFFVIEHGRRHILHFNATYVSFRQGCVI